MASFHIHSGGVQILQEPTVCVYNVLYTCVSNVSCICVSYSSAMYVGSIAILCMYVCMLCYIMVGDEFS